MVPIQNKASFQLFALTSGKPSPSGSGPLRIFQSAQKGPTCFYYAMNMLRRRIGKLPSLELTEARHIEKMISERRKDITSLRQRLDFEKSLAFEIGPCGLYKEHKSYTKEGASSLLALLNDIKKSTKEPPANAILSSILSEFIMSDSFDDLNLFLEDKHNKIMIENGLKFIYLFGESEKTMFSREFPPDTYDTETLWTNLSLFQKRAYVENFAFQITYKAYHLFVSPWRPADGLKGLIETLNKHGPMYTRGLLGRYYFSSPPTLEKLTSGLHVFTLDEKTAILSKSIFHSIIVSGADLEEGSVYFLDPSDESDPSLETYRKTYKISYDFFIQRLGNLKNKYIKDKTYEGSLCQPYGLHAPQ
jgi:hypothetical protein